MGRYLYACPGCGKTVETAAAYRARGSGQPCRGCVRVRTGWACGSCGSTDRDHPSPCPGQSWGPAGPLT